MRVLCLAVWLWCGSNSPVAAQGRVIRFDHLSIEDGLSQSSVFAIAQDQTGFLWFGTQDGLNRYDGYGFRVFKHDPANAGSLSNNYVESLLVDEAGVLWVGTNGGGLNRRDSNGRFQHFKHDPTNPESLGHNRVSALLQDRDGHIWVGTYGGGLQKMVVGAGDGIYFKRFVTAKGASQGVRAIRSMHEDRDGVLWIASADAGLVKFDKYTETLEVLPTEQLPEGVTAITSMLRDRDDFFWVGSENGDLFRFNPSRLEFTPFKTRTGVGLQPQGRIRAMAEDHMGDLWIADDNSLSRLDKSTGRMDRYSHDASDPKGLSGGAANTLFVDRTGVLWIGFSFQGLDRHDPGNNRFTHYRHSPNDPTSLSDNSVMAMLVSQQDELWVGTFAGGVNRLKGGRFLRYGKSSQPGLGPSSNLIAALYEDKDGVIWMGGDNGLDRYNPKSDSFQKVRGDADTPIDNLVLAILESDDDTMWLGLSGSGLVRHNRKSGDFKIQIPPDAGEFSTGFDRVRTLLLDSSHELWAGSTYHGLTKWNLKSGAFSRYRYRPGVPGVLSANRIYALYEDRRDQVWIGTSGGGLNLYNRASDGFSQFRRKDGLPDDTIYAILEDAAGYLWLSSNQGLSRFDPRARRAKTYDVGDGLQSREFNQGAATAGPDGLLYFGGINGFNVFFPEPADTPSVPPIVVMTDFLIFNRSKDPSPGEPGAIIPVEQLRSVDLHHSESVFSFEYTALHFADPEKNSYAHRLVGFDKDWVFTDSDQRRAVYMNLKPGAYRFQVKAANPDGHWSSVPAEVGVRIQPPPWRTWWAWLIYLVLAIASLALIRSFVISKRKVLYEQEMVRGLKNLDKMKDDFLVNTSHELRTPLEGIVGLAETLIERREYNSGDGDSADLHMIANRGRRLITLVNDIQDFSKLKHNDIDLVRKPVDFNTLVNVALALNKPMLGDKSVDMVNDMPAGIPPVDGDEDRLLQMMNNLIGNAVKFTDEGIIRVTAEARDGVLNVDLEDTGRGLPEEHQQAVLGALDQAPTSVSRIFDGTSLGLSICKLVVALHGGRISMETQPGKGTVFHFSLPLMSGAIPVSNPKKVSKIMQGDTNPSIVAPVEKARDLAHILIVDDDEINRRVVANHLGLRNYKLSEASNGPDALKLLEVDDSIDLILLDIMMPRMSGFEVCERLRKTFPIHELPVIVLSARNQVVDLELAFEAGANDYLTKPVAKLELAARVTVHLRILEMNRNLESMVAERTRDLKAGNLEMQELLRRLESKNKEVSTAHQQLVIKEKMANLGTLTAGIAHEIKNPTNYIAISLNNLERALENFESFLIDLAGEDADDEVRDSFQEQFGNLHSHVLVAREGSQRVMSILANLNAVSRSGEAGAVRAPLSDQIASTIRLVETQYKNDIVFDLELKDPLEIECLPNEMSQVFMNLIVNGCQAVMDRWGDQPEKGRLFIGAKLQNGLGVITFKDNGMGMPVKVRERIFEPFFTTKMEQEGTGLGLAISNKIIKRHGGRIEVASTEGEGSTFTLYLPVAAYGEIQPSMLSGDSLH